MRTKTCYCYTCNKAFHSLGIMRHRAMHRDKREDCKIELKNGVYEYHYAKPKTGCSKCDFTSTKNNAGDGCPKCYRGRMEYTR